MYQKSGILAFVLVLSLLLCACTAPAGIAAEEPAPGEQVQQDPQAAPADDAVVASIGDRAVTWAQYRLTFDTYVSYYNEMGFNVFETEDRLSGFQERTVEALLQPIVLIEQAIAKGFDQLSESEAAALEAEIQVVLDGLDDVYLEQVAAEAAQDPTLDQQARIRELIAAESYYYTGVCMDYDTYLKWISNYYREQAYVKALQAATVADCQVTDAEVREAYDKQLQADRAAYTSDPGAYRARVQAEDEIPPLYAPSGYHRVLVLFYPAEDLSSNADYASITARLTELQTAYGELALNKPAGYEEALAAIEGAYTTLRANRQAIIESANAQAMEQAQRAMAQLEAGTPFPSLSEDMRVISLLYTDDQDWSDEAKTAFSELAPGQYTQIIQDAAGCTILYYLEDVPAGSVPLAEVDAKIRASLLRRAQEAAWQAQIEAWMADPAIFRDDALIHAMKGS